MLMYLNKGRRRVANVLYIGLLLCFVGCKRNPNEVLKPETETLVESAPLSSFKREQLVDRLATLGVNVSGNQTLLNLILQRDIETYRLVYKTKNADGTEVRASGALIIPKAIGSEKFPIISLQHSTIFDDNQAPSYFANGADVTAGMLFASNRYIVVCPDYIGYGESKNVPHPYLHRQTEASASLDMLRAARNYVVQKGLPWDNQVFLAGYSQGGHATMALLKMMEEQYPDEFRITGAACGAGPYNVEGFMQDLVSKPSSGNAVYNNMYVWVLQTYNRIYGLNRPMSAYFVEPYASAVQQNGTNAAINVSIDKAFSNAFRTGVTNGTDAELLKAIRDNNVYDWKPRTELMLVHGTADQQVFYRNSTDAYTAMKARGVTNITLTPIEGKDHATTIQDFILGTYAFFTQRRGN